jgi:hypothetical protein
LLALSPLLAPLRFLSRAGLSRLPALRELEPLIARAVDAALPFAGERAAALQGLAQAARGFDAARDPERRVAVAAVVRALGALVRLPDEVAALGDLATQPGAPSKPGSSRAPNVARKPDGATPPKPQPDARAKPGPGSGPGAASVAEVASGTDPLAVAVEHLRGVGPATADHLAAKGLGTVGDLLLNLPRRYEDRRTPRTVAEAPLGERSLILGTIVKAGEAHGRTRRFEALVRDAQGGHLVCIWFHFRGSLLRKLAVGARVLVSGEVRAGYRGAGKTVHHPDVELIAGEPAQALLGEGLSALRGAEDSFGAVVPVYTEIEGVPPRSYRRIVLRALDEYLKSVEDRLPRGLLERRRLLPLQEALRESHFPKVFADA